MSAILLDEAYYELLKIGRTVVDNISLLDTAYLIPFKAKAWLDLSERKNSGDMIDSRDVRKHLNDILRLTSILTPETRIDLPQLIKSDLDIVINHIESSDINVKQIGISGMDQSKLVEILKKVYR